VTGLANSDASYGPARDNPEPPTVPALKGRHSCRCSQNGIRYLLCVVPTRDALETSKAQFDMNRALQEETRLATLAGSQDLHNAVEVFDAREFDAHFSLTDAKGDLDVSIKPVRK
jgi:hypothetical protein